MKLEGFLNTRVAGYAVVALIGGVALYVIVKKLAGAADDAIDKVKEALKKAAEATVAAVDPTEDTNLAYRGASGAANLAATGQPADIAKAMIVSPPSALLGLLTGGGEDSLGGRIYTLFNGAYDPNAPTYVPRKLDVREQSMVYTP